MSYGLVLPQDNRDKSRDFQSTKVTSEDRKIATFEGAMAGQRTIRRFLLSPREFYFILLFILLFILFYCFILLF